MTKKTEKEPAAAVKRAKGKASNPEQLKIANTGRLDAVPEIEKAAKELQAASAKREQAEVAEDEANTELTAALVAASLDQYQYEGKDGLPYMAYVPKARKPKARIRKIKRKKPEKGEE